MNSRKTIIVTALVVLFLGLGAASAILFWPPDPSKQSLLAYQNGDYATALHDTDNSGRPPLKWFRLAAAEGDDSVVPIWREYAYPDQQFAATFPARPEVMKFSGERGVTEVVYYVQHDSERYEVWVFDLLRAGINEATAIAGAAASMREKGIVKLDIPAEVQGHWGHFFSLETNDGRHLVSAVFFRNERLYEIEASAPDSDFEAVSWSLVRFQQSLRFTGTLRSRRFAPQPAQGGLDNIGGRLFGGRSER